MDLNELLIQETDSNPFFEIKPGGELLTISGNSFMTDPRAFYELVMEWAKAHILAEGKMLIVEVTPGYYSTSSVQVFNLLFKTLSANNPGKMQVTFYVEHDEEEDMEETIYSLMFNTGLEATVKYLD